MEEYKGQGQGKAVRKIMKVCRAAGKVRLNLTDVFFKEIKNTFGGRMRMMICGGAAVNPEILEDLQAFGIMALQGYGCRKLRLWERLILKTNQRAIHAA